MSFNYIKGHLIWNIFAERKNLEKLKKKKLKTPT